MPSHNHNNGRNIDRAPKKYRNNYVSKMPRMSFERELDLFAKNLRRDFDRALTRNFGSWDLFGGYGHGHEHRHTPSLLELSLPLFDRNSYWLSDPLFYQSQPVHSFYERKTILHDDDGRTIVKTVKKSPGKPWESYVEEFSNNNKNASLEDKAPEKLEQNQQVEKVAEESRKPEAVKFSEDVEIVDESAPEQTSVEQENTQQTVPEAEGSSQTVEHHDDHANSVQNSQQEVSNSNQNSHENDMLGLFDREFGHLSNTLARTFDPFFGRRRGSFFDTCDLFDLRPLRFNPEQTSYRLKTIVNNNGDVMVKTASKDPGSEWQTSVKHYNKGGSSIEGDKKAEAIAEQQHSSEGKVIDQVGEVPLSDQKSKESNH